MPLVAGFIAYDAMVGHHWNDFWRGSIFVLPQHPALENAHNVPLWVQVVALAVGIGGIALAYIFYVVAPGFPECWPRASMRSTGSC